MTRSRYATIGLALVGVKFTLDEIVARLGFHRGWTPFSYLVTVPGASIARLDGSSLAFVTALVALAIPFVAVGSILTLRRLQDAGLSRWLVLLFFIPVVNLALFATLCIVPTRRASAHEPAWARDRIWPQTRLGSALVAALATSLVGVAYLVFNTHLFAGYGWGVFVAGPFAQGFLAQSLHAARSRRTIGDAISVALLSVALTGLFFLLLGLEGLTCVAMACPLAAVLAIAGALAAVVTSGGGGAATASIVLLVAVAPPALMAAAPVLTPAAPLYMVRTTVDVDAPPQRVWSHVISFPDLPPPHELLFRAGVAYPMRAHIVGEGVGTTRYCEFSTGSFVEPIRVWNAPRRLAFDVVRNPPPMRELSPYPDVDTPHLRGYLLAERGEFELLPLPGGRTRLVGTTWYRHHLWPAGYWRWWSDGIIHLVHSRVLDHVRRLSESDAHRPGPSALVVR
jgi:hypothetical protein